METVDGAVCSSQWSCCTTIGHTSRAEMGDCGAHVTLSHGGQFIDASASGASNARWSRVVDDDSTARRWEYNSKAMAAQQEVMAMQETELPAVMQRQAMG